MKWEFDGKRVKQRREELGLRQHHLAVKFGINQPQLSRVEKGLSTPVVKFICDLAWALDVSPSYFFVPLPD